MRKIISILSVLWIACVAMSWAQNIPSPPSPPRLVNDFANIFSATQRAQLEDSLVMFDRTTSTQIAVVTVNSLDGYAPADYALEIQRKWGVGQKDKNNGIVMLIKPRNANGRGQVYIAVGFGLEGILPDAKATRIIDREMMPALKQGDYFTAAERGAQALRDAVRGEYTAGEKDQSEDFISSMIGGLIFVIIMIVVLVLVGRGNKNHDGNNDSGDSAGGSGGSRRGSGLPPIFWGLGGMGSGGAGRGGGGFGGSGGGFGGFGGGFGGGGGGGRSF